MLDHAFSTLGLHRVGLAVFEFNERAIRSYLKVGFVVEGRSRDAIWRDGRHWDELQMSILEEEWRVVRERVLGMERPVVVGSERAVEASGPAGPSPQRAGS